MRQRAPSLAHEDYSSSSSTSPTTRQRGFERQRVRRPHPRSVSSADEPTFLGSVGKLVRLAVLALVLALVVPYVKTHLFGGLAGNSSAAVTNATVDPASKNPYHHHPPQRSASEEGGRRDDEVDVFNFSHQDYLASSAQKARKGVVASASPSAVVAKQPQRIEQQAKSNANPRTGNRNISHDDDDAEPSSTSTSSHLLRLLTALPSPLLALVRFLAIPFIHLFRLALSLCAHFYHGLRFALSHMLRPILHILAPLTYLLSGVLFVFVATPYRLVSAIVTELYPVYIFLGAAMVVGIAMGLAAAAVLYLTAFVFVDRIPQGKVEERAKSRSTSSSAGRDSYFQHKPSARQEYMNDPYAAYPSPLVSPTIYRSATRQDRNPYPSYSTVPSSSLRASVA